MTDEEHFSPFTQEIKKVMHKARRTILNIEIKTTIWMLNKCENTVRQLEETLGNTLDNDLLKRLLEFVKNKYKIKFEEIKTNIKKMERWDKSRIHNKTAVDKKAIFNYTNVTLLRK